jgi:hypothetical protein
MRVVMVGIKDLSTFQARMTFSSSRLALIELSRVLAVKPQAIAEARLTSSDYAQMKAELNDSGMLIVDDEGAEDRLMEFRSRYEPFLIGLSEYPLLTLPNWLPSPQLLDNWQNSPRALRKTFSRCSSIQTSLTLTIETYSTLSDSTRGGFCRGPLSEALSVSLGNYVNKFIKEVF